MEKPFRQATVEAAIAEELAKRRADKTEDGATVVSLERSRRKRDS